MILTERELKIVELLALPNKEIASKLNYSPFTVKAYIKGINTKLGTKNKTAILLYCIKRGWINIFRCAIPLADLGFWDNKGNYKTDFQEVINE